MRILYIGLIPPKYGGKITCGVAIHGWDLARNAIIKGHDVLYLSNVHKDYSKANVDGIIVIKTPTLIKKAIIGLVKYAKMYCGNKHILKSFPFRERIAIIGKASFLKNIITIYKPDIIHIHEDNDWAISSRISSSILPIIISYHGNIAANDESTHYKKKTVIMSCASRAILVSISLKKRNQKFFMDKQNDVYIINNPIDINKIPLIKDKEHLRNKYNIENKVVFFSGICESIRIKGLDILLEAYKSSELLRKNTSLIIVADKQGVELAEEQFKKNGIRGRIFLNQQWDKLVELYNLADVFVLPSRSEAFPLVFIEALAVGTPIVGYEDSVAEIEEIIGLKIGERYNPVFETVKELENKIFKALSKNINRENIREMVKAKLSWERLFPKYESVYYSCALKNDTKNSE